MNPVLPGAPWLIAHRSMLGINKPYKVTLNGIDYVLWQSTEGKISALENICPHMQAPLSSGWICGDRNTIACPFHGLEFDGAGRLLKTSFSLDKEHTNRASANPLAEPLEIVVSGDFIWTYGNQGPQLEIPTLHQSLTADATFVGVTGDKHIGSDFLRALMVNYDFNHAPAVHRYPLRLKEGHAYDYEENGYYTRLTQDIVREKNTWWEKLKDPSLVFTPMRYTNAFEYIFPSTTSIIADLPDGKLISLLMLYPEHENCTRTFVLVFAQTAKRWLVPLLRSHILKAFDLVVQQDADMLAQLYERTQPSIRLPQEEVMFYAEKLYRNWPTTLY